ncbi:MAG: hypothetical protein H0W64_08905 [Gammaproteobacteria bacterium]|nr:hypothetical protein [Gammaproteobacteria bacterium]
MLPSRSDNLISPNNQTLFHRFDQLLNDIDAQIHYLSILSQELTQTKITQLDVFLKTVKTLNESAPLGVNPALKNLVIASYPSLRDIILRKIPEPNQWSKFQIEFEKQWDQTLRNKNYLWLIHRQENNEDKALKENFLQLLQTLANVSHGKVCFDLNKKFIHHVKKQVKRLVPIIEDIKQNCTDLTHPLPSADLDEAINDAYRDLQISTKKFKQKIKISVDSHKQDIINFNNSLARIEQDLTQLKCETIQLINQITSVCSELKEEKMILIREAQNPNPTQHELSALLNKFLLFQKKTQLLPAIEDNALRARMNADLRRINQSLLDKINLMEKDLRALNLSINQHRNSIATSQIPIDRHPYIHLAEALKRLYQNLESTKQDYNKKQIMRLKDIHADSTQNLTLLSEAIQYLQEYESISAQIQSRHYPEAQTLDNIYTDVDKVIDRLAYLIDNFLGNLREAFPNTQQAYDEQTKATEKSVSHLKNKIFSTNQSLNEFPTIVRNKLLYDIDTVKQKLNRILLNSFSNFYQIISLYRNRNANQLIHAVFTDWLTFEVTRINLISHKFYLAQLERFRRNEIDILERHLTQLDFQLVMFNAELPQEFMNSPLLNSLKQLNDLSDEAHADIEMWLANFPHQTKAQLLAMQNTIVLLTIKVKTELAQFDKAVNEARLRRIEQDKGGLQPRVTEPDKTDQYEAYQTRNFLLNETKKYSETPAIQTNKNKQALLQSLINTLADDKMTPAEQVSHYFELYDMHHAQIAPHDRYALTTWLKKLVCFILPFNSIKHYFYSNEEVFTQLETQVDLSKKAFATHPVNPTHHHIAQNLANQDAAQQAPKIIEANDNHYVTQWKNGEKPKDKPQYPFFKQPIVTLKVASSVDRDLTSQQTLYTPL